MSVYLGSNNCVSPSILLIILFWFNSMKVLRNKWQEKILRTEVSDRKNHSTVLYPEFITALGTRGFFVTQILIVCDETATENGNLIKLWATEFYFILCISRTDRWSQGSLSPLSLSFHIAISMVYSFIVRRESLAFPRLFFLVFKNIQSHR